jgi:hypothetical protein
MTQREVGVSPWMMTAARHKNKLSKCELIKWMKIWIQVFLISNFRRVLDIVSSLLGVSPASDFCMPTFRNHPSVPSSKA